MATKTKKKAATNPDTPATSTSSATSSSSPALWDSSSFAKGRARKVEKIYIEDHDAYVHVMPISARHMRTLHKFHLEAKKAESGDEDALADVLSRIEDIADILAGTYCNPDGSQLATPEDWEEYDINFMMEMVGLAVTGGKKTAANDDEATDGDSKND